MTVAQTSTLKRWLTQWLAWFVPRTLRARLIGLILVAVLLTQALTLYAVTVYQRQQLQVAATNLLVTSITTLQSAIAMIAPPKRAMFVHHASNGQWQLLQTPPPARARFLSAEGLRPAADGESHAIRHSLRRLSRDINRALGSANQVAVTAGPQPYLYVSIDQRGPGQWLRIPLDRVDPPITTPMVVWWLMALGFLLLVAAWFSWHITRPITRLVKATDQLALGHPESVVPSGPVETRRLGERFNAMLQSLQQSRRAQQTLLAGLPHDLKGPLSRMALRIEMTDDEMLKLGLKRDLNDMQRMVEQFLDFMRGQDIDRLSMRTLRLDEWLQAQISEEQRLGKPVTLISPQALPVVTIKADAAALNRLLSNLVDNALTHGQPPVQISLETTATEAVLRVTDHGSGIEANDYQRAFEPFERLDQARTKTGSVGLGLSLVKGLVLAHGGRVALGRAPQGGLEVSVFFPLLASVKDSIVS
jgi:two-component system osmolarity sensor histidine kinase EnvZ